MKVCTACVRCPQKLPKHFSSLSLSLIVYSMPDLSALPPLSLPTTQKCVCVRERERRTNKKSPPTNQPTQQRQKSSRERIRRRKKRAGRTFKSRCPERGNCCCCLCCRCRYTHAANVFTARGEKMAARRCETHTRNTTASCTQKQHNGIHISHQLHNLLHTGGSLSSLRIQCKTKRLSHPSIHR